jgi:hypothetical protein
LQCCSWFCDENIGCDAVDCRVSTRPLGFDAG